jgi:hypothetical protein
MAGRLAALIGNPAEITPRRPPPLETEMRVERAGQNRPLALSCCPAATLF